MRDTNVNIAAGNDTPIVRFTGSPVSGTTIGNAGSFPILRDQLDHQLVDNLSWILADSHSIKAGVDIAAAAARRLRRQQLARPLDLQPRLRRRHLRHRLRRVPRRLHRLVRHRLRSVPAREPPGRDQRLRRGQLARPSVADAQSRLPLRVRRRRRGSTRAASTTASAPTTTTTSRGSAPPGRCRAGRGWLQALTGAASGDASLRGGYGLYHGRIFQSVFSQNGASLRTNPPYALARTITTAPGILNVSDPTLGFVFVPGPQTVRHAITIAATDLGMPYTHQWSASYERKLPLELEPAPHLQRQSRHRHAQVRARQPAAVAARWADHRGQPSQQRARPPASPICGARSSIGWPPIVQCAGTGLPGIAPTAACPVAVPIADNEISLRVPRTNERRADPRYTLEPDRQQRRRVVVRRPADRVGQAARPRPHLHHQLHPQPVARHDVGSHLRRRRRLEPAGARQPLREGLLALPHAAPLQLQRQLSAAVLARPRRRGRRAARRLAGLGGDPARLGHAVHRQPDRPRSELRRVRRGPAGRRRSIGARDDRSTIRPPPSRCCRASAFRAYTIGDTIDQVAPRNSMFGDGLDNVDLGLYKAFRFAARPRPEPAHRGLQRLRHGPVRVPDHRHRLGHVRPDLLDPRHLHPAHGADRAAVSILKRPCLSRHARTAPRQSPSAPQV